MEHLWDCILPPGPEGSADHVLRERQVDVYPRCPVSPHPWTAALHDPLVLAHGVVEAVEHSAGLVQVADEEVVSVGIVEPSDLGLGQLRLVELAPVAGGFRKRARRSAREVVLVVPADIRDGVIGAIISADHITRLRDVSAAILGDIDGAVRIFAECGGGYHFRFVGLVRIDGDGVGLGVVGDAKI